MYKHYPVDWNGQTRTLAIPQENLAAEIGMTDFPALQDPWQAIVDAMENPVDCAPISESLKPGHKVVVMTGRPLHRRDARGAGRPGT